MGASAAAAAAAATAAAAAATDFFCPKAKKRSKLYNYVCNKFNFIKLIQR